MKRLSAWRDKPKDLARSVGREFGDIIINLPFVQRLPRFAHYSRQYTPLILMAGIGWSYIPLGSNPWWLRVLNILYVYATTYAIWAGISHTARLCDRCIARFPLNGSELAATRRHRLWANHFHWKRWIFGPLAAELMIQFVGPRFGLRGMWNALAWTPFALLFIWGYWRIMMTHDRLSAWCPWCRHNRPPDDVLEPDPDPSQNLPVPA